MPKVGISTRQKTAALIRWQIASFFSFFSFFWQE
jgi:hypothetical protein